MKVKSPIIVAAVTACLLGGAVSASAQNWTLSSAPTNFWVSIASSADGSRVVALTTGLTSPATEGGIYVSTNSGATWIRTLTTSSNLGWKAVASSADGRNLVAVSSGVIGTTGGPICSSTDYGMTWTNVYAPTNFWQAVASSADGTKLVAAASYPYGAPIYTSTNSGATWVQSGAFVKNWSAVATSADGTKLAAAVKDGNEFIGGQLIQTAGMIYTSTNSGATWTPSNAPRTNWLCIASSADGTKLAAGVANGVQSVNGHLINYVGLIYISTNSGASWRPTSAPRNNWQSMASSADGNALLASTLNSPNYSTNGGGSWVSNSLPGVPPNNGALSTAAMSADGYACFVTWFSSGIFTAHSPPQPTLGLESSQNNLAVSWIAPSTNFMLQSATTCGIGWVDISTPPVMNLTNLKYEVVFPLTNSMGFFRLESR